MKKDQYASTKDLTKELKQSSITFQGWEEPRTDLAQQAHFTDEQTEFTNTKTDVSRGTELAGGAIRAGCQLSIYRKIQ